MLNLQPVTYLNEKKNNFQENCFVEDNVLHSSLLNPFYVLDSFLYPLNTSKNLKIFLRKTPSLKWIGFLQTRDKLGFLQTKHKSGFRKMLTRHKSGFRNMQTSHKLGIRKMQTRHKSGFRKMQTRHKSGFRKMQALIPSNFL